MKKADINHLRRLVGWVQAEVGQSPEEMEATLRDIAQKMGHVDIDDEAKARLVQAHDKARTVPKYVREAVKALEKYLGSMGEVVDAQSDVPVRPSVPNRAGLATPPSGLIENDATLDERR